MTNAPNAMEKERFGTMPIPQAVNGFGVLFAENQTAIRN
jgi:hypothetical protein